jgi:enoyl-CoA hydratase/carnithine racemase
MGVSFSESLSSVLRGSNFGARLAHVRSTCEEHHTEMARESRQLWEDDMTKSPFLLRHDDEGVVTIVLNRPESRNGLSLGMLGALRDALAAVAADSSARVVILAGAGPAFCAGHDLKEMRARDYDPAYVVELFALCAEVMQAIVALPKPVIARVHGVATAAGAQLVASADLALAADDARFATPGVQIGLFCSTPMVALSRNIARKHAMQMLLTGDLIDAGTALRFGLVNDVAPAAELEARALALARKIAAKSSLTLAIGKMAFYRQAELPLAEAYAYASDVMAENLKARDAREGIGAFLDKRAACWTGE